MFVLLGVCGVWVCAVEFLEGGAVSVMVSWVLGCSVGCVILGLHGVPCFGNGSQCVQCVFGIHVSVDCLVGGFVLFGQVDDCGGVLVCDEYL